MNNKHPRLQRLLDRAADKRFFYLIIVLLAVQATWIALSGRYPMAFDEDFHLGIIRLYSDHISPFWSGHPAGGDAFGAVARDPSYLYHYLMSFPYRLAEAITSSQSAQVIFLRLINIGLFSWGLVLFRRLLANTGASATIINLSLLAFVLVPIVPLLAAQINYDNLIMPLTALALLLTIELSRQLNSQKPQLSLKTWLKLLLVCVFASLVKFAFLPIIVGIAVFLAAFIVRRFSLSQLKAASKNLTVPSKRVLVPLTALLLLLLVLFAERYGLNVARYSTPVADCGQVLSYEQCRHYGPWIRDYNFNLNKPANLDGPLGYSDDWLHGMWFRTFFAVDGPQTNFQTRGPLTLPGLGSAIVGVLSAAAFVLACKRLWRRYSSPVLWLWTGVSIIYVFALWLEEYKLYKFTGVPVAINGRYLLPILPLLILLAALSINELIQKSYRLRLAVATAVIACLAWGGGALTYILRSNDAWYWDNAAVRKANHAVQKIGPAVPGHNRPTQYMP